MQKQINRFGFWTALLFIGVFFSCASAKPALGDAKTTSPAKARVTVDSLLLDAIGQVYVWHPDNSLEKIKTAIQLADQDTLRYRYHNVRLGKLQSVDLTNPLRPVLFYADAQTVVLLHRNLVELRLVNLIDFGIASADAVAYAPNDGLWVYSADNQRLILLDQNGKIIYQSVELSQLFGKSIRAEELVATPSQVAFATTDGRILLFGPFAAYRTEILRKGHNLLANEDRLLFFEGNNWWNYSGPNSLLEPLDLKTDGRKLVSIRGEYVLWQSGKKWWVEQM